MDSNGSQHYVAKQEQGGKRKERAKGNLNFGRASHLTSDLGKTNAFAMLMKVSVEDSSTFFACEERSSSRKVKLAWQLEAV